MLFRPITGGVILIVGWLNVVSYKLINGQNFFARCCFFYLLLVSGAGRVGGVVVGAK